MGQSDTSRHSVGFTRRLFNGDNFARSAALAVIYALLSAILDVSISIACLVVSQRPAVLEKQR